MRIHTKFALGKFLEKLPTKFHFEAILSDYSFVTTSKKELLFFLAYILYLSINALGLTFYAEFFGEAFRKGIVVAALLLLIVKEFYVNRLTVKSIFYVAISIFLFYMLWYAGRSFLGATFIFIWSARDIEFRKIAKVTIVILTVIMLFTIISAHLGIIENYVSYAGWRTRHYIGFLYCLFPAYMYYNVASLYIYLRKSKIKWLEIIIMFAVNYYIYAETVSRLAFCLTCFVLFAGLVLKYFPDIFERLKALSVCMRFSYLICAATSIGLTFFYNGAIPWMANLNRFLGSRLSLGLNSLNNYGIQLLSRKLKWNGFGLNPSGELAWQSSGEEVYDFVDSLYLSILQREGMLVFFILILILTITLIRLYEKKDYYALLFLSLAAFETVIANTAIYFHYCTFIFVVTAIIDPFVIASNSKLTHKEAIMKHHDNVTQVII